MNGGWDVESAPAAVVFRTGSEIHSQGCRMLVEAHGSSRQREEDLSCVHPHGGHARGKAKQVTRTSNGLLMGAGLLENLGSVERQNSRHLLHTGK